MTVPDVETARRFYVDFGLNTNARGDCLDVSIQGQAGPCLTIAEGPRKRVHHLSLAAFEDDIPRFALHLKECGVERLAPPADFESNGLWFRDHDGMLVEICVAPKTTPDRKGTVLWPAAVENSARAPSRSQARKDPPTRMSHVLFFTSNVDKAVDFYTRVIGLRLSDRAGDDIAFMHGVHGSDHHVIAFVKAEGPGLHHLSWDVPSVNHIGLGAMQMADKGFIAGWGLGRHVLGSNYFHYVRDPWGSYSEYSSDVDYIPVDHDWKSGDHPPEDSFYVWGPTPPAEFAINHEAIA